MESKTASLRTGGAEDRGTMAFADWTKIVKRVAEAGWSSADIACPECKRPTVDFQYVGYPESRMGILRIWCWSCRKGVDFDRVKIPETAPMLSFDAPQQELERRMPQFLEIEPEAD